MLKLTLTAAALSVALFTPAIAQDMKCDDPTITAMEQEMYQMADPKAKQEAMEHLILAKGALKDNDMTKCMEHMAEAAKNMKKT